ncbi:MAG: hypothetical protein IMZ60_04180 [Actinobacteria bacterium]|nr:hypothetical protein [Actinomycetota bacterium]
MEPNKTEETKRALQNLFNSIGKEIQSYYITQNKEGDIFPVVYFFWVSVICCPNCSINFEAHPHYILSEERKKGEKIVFCKNCHSVSLLKTNENKLICHDCGHETLIDTGVISKGNYYCPECGTSGSLLSLAESGNPFQKKLFAVEYEIISEKGKAARKYKKADEFDFRVFNECKQRFDQLKEYLIFPKGEIPIKGRSDPRPVNYGYQYYYQLFNERQLLSLSLLWKEILKIEDKDVKEDLAISFSDSLAANNMLCRYAFGYQKLTPLFGLHAYDVVTRPVENNVWGTKLGRGSFSKCVEKMLEGKRYAEKPYEFKYEGDKSVKVFTGEKISKRTISYLDSDGNYHNKCILLNRSSLHMDDFKNNSIDLVLTDPPYYDNLSYSELSDFYYVWLKDLLSESNGIKGAESAPYRKSLFVNGNDDKSPERFINELTKIFSNCKRVLKSDGLMVFSFHHKKINAWISIAKALLTAGFRITNVFPVRSEGKSGFHSFVGSIKWDCILVCRPNDIEQNFRGTTQSDFSSEFRYWVERIKSSNLDFSEADECSLKFGIAIQNAVNNVTKKDDLEKLIYSFL